jgi:antitoxin component HigA of HigAB toxin-antitoxin module
MSETSLHKLMRAAGLIDADLAARTGWSRSQICRVRNGSMPMTMRLAMALSRELGVPADVLMEDAQVSATDSSGDMAA